MGSFLFILNFEPELGFSGEDLLLSSSFAFFQLSLRSGVLFFSLLLFLVFLNHQTLRKEIFFYLFCLFGLISSALLPFLEMTPGTSGKVFSVT